jgi:hypothetical protein
MANLIKFPVAKTFSQEGELAQRIEDLIYEYANQISLVSVLGVLEIVKMQIRKDSDGQS